MAWILPISPIKALAKSVLKVSVQRDDPAYQKPLSDYRIDEGTPLANPYWQYSRNKIAGEELLMKLYREEGFPVTIQRR